MDVDSSKQQLVSSNNIGATTLGKDWATGSCIPDDGSDLNRHLECEMEDYIASSDGCNFKERRYSFMNGLRGTSVTFRVELRESNNNFSRKELVVPEDILSLTVHHLKLVMEKEYSIPASSLSLCFSDCLLEDPLLLSHYKLREGDCLTTTFEGVGDLKNIMDILESMKKTCSLLKSLEHHLQRGTVEESMMMKFNL